MPAVTLETARNAAIIAVVVLIAVAVASALLMKSIAQKAAAVVVVGLLALLVWTQRAALDDCADRVQSSLAVGVRTDTTCTFLGQDVTIKSPRSTDDSPVTTDD
jgi:ABC-type transport system involved in cytochrome bd biosynthesis fused ATPase/permease subunit